MEQRDKWSVSAFDELFFTSPLAKAYVKSHAWRQNDDEDAGATPRAVGKGRTDQSERRKVQSLTEPITPQSVQCQTSTDSDILCNLSKHSSHHDSNINSDSTQARVMPCKYLTPTMLLQGIRRKREKQSSSADKTIDRNTSMDDSLTSSSVLSISSVENTNPDKMSQKQGHDIPHKQLHKMQKLSGKNTQENINLKGKMNIIGDVDMEVQQLRRNETNTTFDVGSNIKDGEVVNCSEGSKEEYVYERSEPAAFIGPHSEDECAIVKVEPDDDTDLQLEEAGPDTEMGQGHNVANPSVDNIDNINTDIDNIENQEFAGTGLDLAKTSTASRSPSKNAVKSALTEIERVGKEVTDPPGTAENATKTLKQRTRSQSRAAQVGLGVNVSKKEEKVEVTKVPLDQWIFQIFEGGKVRLEGRRRDVVWKYLWHSSFIVERKTPRLLVTDSGSIYQLVHEIDEYTAYQEGLSKQIVRAFRNGFPGNWKELIQQEINRQVRRRQCQSTEVKDGGRTSKRGIQKGHGETSGGRNKGLKEKDSENEEITKDKKSRKNKTPSVRRVRSLPIDGFSFKGSIDDPIDLDELPTTRSGRRIKPKLAWWAGQRLVYNITADMMNITPIHHTSLNDETLSTSVVHFKEDKALERRIRRDTKRYGRMQKNVQKKVGYTKSDIREQEAETSQEERFTINNTITEPEKTVEGKNRGCSDLPKLVVSNSKPSPDLDSVKLKGQEFIKAIENESEKESDGTEGERHPSRNLSLRTRQKTKKNSTTLLAKGNHKQANLAHEMLPEDRKDENFDGTVEASLREFQEQSGKNMSKENPTEGEQKKTERRPVKQHDRKIAGEKGIYKSPRVLLNKWNAMRKAVTRSEIYDATSDLTQERTEVDKKARIPAKRGKGRSKKRWTAKEPTKIPSSTSVSDSTGESSELDKKAEIHEKWGRGKPKQQWAAKEQGHRKTLNTNQDRPAGKCKRTLPLCTEAKDDELCISDQSLHVEVLDFISDQKNKPSNDARRQNIRSKIDCGEDQLCQSLVSTPLASGHGNYKLRDRTKSTNTKPVQQAEKDVFNSNSEVNQCEKKSCHASERKRGKHPKNNTKLKDVVKSLKNKTKDSEVSRGSTLKESKDLFKKLGKGILKQPSTANNQEEQVSKKKARQENEKLRQKKGTSREEDGDGENRPWNTEEQQRLYRALLELDATRPMFWEFVAARVMTRTAMECEAFHHSEAPINAHKKSKRNPQQDQLKEPVKLTSKVGTMKRKRQLREMLDQHDKDYEDDMFESTPFKRTKTIKVPNMDDSGDDGFFGNQPAGLIQSSLQTPTAHCTWLPQSEKKTPRYLFSPGLLKSVDRNAADCYINRVQKSRRNRLPYRPTSQETVTSKKSSSVKAAATAQLTDSKLFKAAECPEDDASSEDEDYYFSDGD